MGSGIGRCCWWGAAATAWGGEMAAWGPHVHSPLTGNPEMDPLVLPQPNMQINKADPGNIVCHCTVIILELAHRGPPASFQLLSTKCCWSMAMPVSSCVSSGCFELQRTSQVTATEALSRASCKHGLSDPLRERGPTLSPMPRCRSSSMKQPCKGVNGGCKQIREECC